MVTSVSIEASRPLGFGRSTVQAVPSQRIARGMAWLPMVMKPTAQAVPPTGRGHSHEAVLGPRAGRAQPCPLLAAGHHGGRPSLAELVVQARPAEADGQGAVAREGHAVEGHVGLRVGVPEPGVAGRFAPGHRGSVGEDLRLRSRRGVPTHGGRQRRRQRIGEQQGREAERHEHRAREPGPVRHRYPRLDRTTYLRIGGPVRTVTGGTTGTIEPRATLGSLTGRTTRSGTDR